MPTKPILKKHEGVSVVRDDLYPGGTKARYFRSLFEEHDHVVYASPAEGGAQTALAWAAREAGKKCTIFTADRKVPHARAHAAKRLGADVILVPHGYLNVVQSKARTYCERTGAYELPFGAHVGSAVQEIADTAALLGQKWGEVWCAGGSGTLAEGLGRAFPKAKLYVVEVGRSLASVAIGRPFTIISAGMPFSRASRAHCPFPSDPHYDRKAWAQCFEKSDRDKANVLFWNVTGPAEDIP